MTLPRTTHDRALMATSGGALALIAAPAQIEGDAPASFAQFLQIERARERQRNAQVLRPPFGKIDPDNDPRPDTPHDTQNNPGKAPR